MEYCPNQAILKLAIPNIPEAYLNMSSLARLLAGRLEIG